MNRTLRTLLLSLFTVLLVPAASNAAPVYYDFEGACVSTSGDGCSAFGLAEGGSVSGTLTIDSANVAGGTSLDIEGLAGTDFSFTFGNQSFDLGDFSDSIIEVTFNGDASALTCLSGLFGCPGSPTDYVDWQNGDAELQTYFDHVNAEFFGVPSLGGTGCDDLVGDSCGGSATADGSWTRRDAPIPEPSAALSFLVGGLVIGGAKRRRARRR